MNRTTRSACLFGGALLTAGLHAPAMADFVIVTTTHDGGVTAGPYAYSYTLTPAFSSDFEIGGGVGPTSASSSIPGSGSVDVLINSEVISGVMAEEPNEAFGYLAFMTDFGVDVETEVTLTWDFDSGITNPNRVFKLRDVTNVNQLFEYNPLTDGDAGELQFVLVPGVEYRTEALIRAFVGTSNASVQITRPICPSGDINGDGIVDTADLGILIGQFGTGCSNDEK